ncbi:MAG: response regulator transcription factor [Pseudomonadota bacterium]
MNVAPQPVPPDADVDAKILIIDDHPLFRDALSSAVSLAYPAAETREAGSIDEASEILAADSGFDLALLDLNIPGVKGFEGLLRLRTNFPQLPVVVVSGHEDARVIDEALSYGSAGFIPKSTRKPELAGAIRTVMEGEVFLPPKYEPFDPAEEDSWRRGMIERLSSLTAQQLRVLHMLREGLLNKQIAYELDVGETTVKAHVSEILRKLKVVSRTQAVIEVSKLDQEDLLNLEDQFLN